MIPINVKSYEDPIFFEKKSIDKSDLINRFIVSQDYKFYLEIGLGYAETWNYIVCDNKVCIDPNPFTGNTYLDDELRSADPNSTWHIAGNEVGNLEPTYKMTSDEFFEKTEISKWNFTFDIIYIDGDHAGDQVYKDAINSLNYLSSGGCLVLHDTGPATYIKEPSDNEGCGTAYKAWIKLRSPIKRVSMMSYIFSSHDVVGIIHFDNPDKKYSIENKEYDDSWEFYKENTKEILNLKTYNEIIESLESI